MSYTISFQQEAVADMQSAFEWCEEQKRGLGDLFLMEVETCVDKLRKNPLQYGLANKWIRKIKMKKFPFLIIYEIEHKTVFINTIFHTSRKPIQ